MTCLFSMEEKSKTDFIPKNPSELSFLWLYKLKVETEITPS